MPEQYSEFGLFNRTLLSLVYREYRHYLSWHLTYVNRRFTDSIFTIRIDEIF